MTDLACKACGRAILLVTADITDGHCRPCYKKVELDKRKEAARLAGPRAEELSEPLISRLTASPEALRLMPEAWFWSAIDGGSPFGNDTGADTVAYFAEWRRGAPLQPVSRFLDWLFDRWAIERELQLTLSEAELVELLPARHFHILVGDDAIVAAAFAQLVFEGKVEPQLCRSTVAALSRQWLDTVISFRGWADPLERKKRVTRMLEVLHSVGAES